MSFIQLGSLQAAPIDQVGSVSESVLNDRESQLFSSSIILESSIESVRDNRFGLALPLYSIQEEYASESEVMEEIAPNKQSLIQN